MKMGELNLCVPGNKRMVLLIEPLRYQQVGDLLIGNYLDEVGHVESDVGRRTSRSRASTQKCKFVI